MLTSRTGDRANEQGYTLLELLIVLIILGIGTAATAQLVMHRLPGFQLDASSAGVAAMLREARSVAIRDNREQPVVIDFDARTLQIGTGGRKHQLEGNIGISLFTASSELEGQRGAIRFFPDGTSTGGRVRLFADARANEIVVQWLTGHVEIREDVQ
ncbi:MAG TPA: GspH/FimT family pseudopilin [Burkholderiales bacterium]|jgi:general secretion pathway protein H|nr:GspH/FimT family pseudopilin [Burkholderiales bacterium]